MKPRHRAASGVHTATVLSAVVCTLAVGGVVAGFRFAAPSPDAARGVAGGVAFSPSAALPTAPPTAPPITAPAVPPARPPGSSAELPVGAPVPAKGTGSWRVVPGRSAQVGQGRVRTYTVEVENGITAPDGDAVFASTVASTLADPRSWIGRGDIALRRVDGGQPDLRIRLASQRTARTLCGYEIPVDVSCRSGGTVYLSAARWVRGAVAFGDDVTGYRQYVVNHEVGHFFRYGHRPCGTDGAAAPVMMQQTFSTSNDEILKITAASPQGVSIPRDGKTCQPNPWPFPTT